MDETPAGAPADEPPLHVAAPPRRPDPWLREAVLILVSITLGFAASEFGQYRQERGLARLVLRAVTEEVKQNEATLSVAAAKHREWEKALRGTDPSAADKAAFWLLIDSRPEAAGSITVPLKSAAWQMVVSTGALRLLDFEVGQAISDIYTTQMLLTELHSRTVGSALWTPAAFDAATREVSAKLIWAVMSEVAGNEEALVGLYRQHLPQLQRAAENR
jgi:hypothetical protein